MNQRLILELLTRPQVEMLVPQPDRSVDPESVAINRSIVTGSMHGLEDPRFDRPAVAVKDCDDAAHWLAILVGNGKSRHNGRHRMT